MKSYSIICALLYALVIVSCSTSEDTSAADAKESYSEADYVLLLSDGESLFGQLVGDEGAGIVLNDAPSTFESTELPEITFRNSKAFGFYQENGSCDGQVVLHDFGSDSSKAIDAFPNLSGCNLTVTALAFEKETIFLAYVVHETSKVNHYFVRVIDTESDGDPIDITLDKKPLELACANDQLFVLTIDHEITDENALSVVDKTTNTIVYETGLGYDAERIFVNSDQNLIIAYPELHSVLTSGTMGIDYVGYDDGKEPKFHASRSDYLDKQGRLYYRMPTDGLYAHIPAIYDFKNNLTILYYFENLFTEAQLGFEFNIGDTSMVSYDETNSIMLIGYSKADKPDQGGLLRIQLEPEPKLLDHIDLEGVPRYIFYK